MCTWKVVDTMTNAKRVTLFCLFFPYGIYFPRKKTCVMCFAKGKHNIFLGKQYKLFYAFTLHINQCNYQQKK